MTTSTTQSPERGPYIADFLLKVHDRRQGPPFARQVFLVALFGSLPEAIQQGEQLVPILSKAGYDTFTLTKNVIGAYEPVWQHKG